MHASVLFPLARSNAWAGRAALCTAQVLLLHILYSYSLHATKGDRPVEGWPMCVASGRESKRRRRTDIE